MFSVTIIAEHFIIGICSWLWFIYYLPFIYNIDYPKFFSEPTTDKTLIIGAIVILTYLLGALTESISLALEKILAGKITKPRKWFTKIFGNLPEEYWIATRHQIWNSAIAEKEFLENRLRISIGRGMATNAIIGLLSYCLCNGETFFDKKTAALIAIAIFVVGLISWGISTYEYRARVRVAYEVYTLVQKQTIIKKG